ncbi:MAG TPA: copper chaperone PCu(A)C [Ilumatobacteraceae bacterium]|nr:copper chaperone PCu(A)C [Ilumatobacteraceae bacterium]
MAGALAAVVAVGALGGCGDDESPSGDDDAAAVEVSEAWARSSPAGVTDGAAYLTIESAADDQLIGAAVPADVAAAVELHETEESGGAMTMQQVSAVELPAGDAVVFDPGDLHIMLIDLAGPLESGSSFELTLTFAEAAPQTVTVDVRDEAP